MQRRRYLAEALGEGPAAELGLALSGDPVLDDLTRTPFILAEVTALFHARLPIPRTKLGLLEAVVGLMERSEEHAGQLQGPPLRGLSDQYLRALAVYLTARGDVLLTESDARPICRAVSELLRISGQISAPPEPDDVLNALTSHHILERVEYPNTSFRFEHQQFQEYYCALMLRDELGRMVASGDPAQAEGFESKYVNNPSWEEPLRMIAAESNGTTSSIAAGAALVRLALRVDSVLAAKLSHLAGQSVWKEIRSDVHNRLRALYAAPSQQLREYALTAMLATGSEEFGDILIPLLTSPDQQVRLHTYRSGMPFHPSTLGPDWRPIVATWTEGLRAEFASELTMHQGMIEVGLFFARSDPSLAVRLAALQGLSWMGQYDAVAKILQSLPDSEFEQAIVKFHLEEIPPALYPRAIAAYKTLLDRVDDRKARLQIALALAEINDPDTPVRLKAELNTLPLDLVRELSDYLLRPAIDILRAADPQWLSEWVTDRVIQGGFWRDNWLSLILQIPQSPKDQLLQRAETEDLRRSGGGGVIAILRATADADTGRAVFIAYRDHHRVLLADPQNQEKQAIDAQLRGLLGSIPRAVLIDGLSDLLAQPPENEGLAIITELFILRGAANDEANEVLAEPQRNRLRTYLKSAVRFILEQDDFNGQGKGYLSSALARVGEQHDMTDIIEMIRADIIRMREGRAARARDHRLPRARASSASWTPWHMEALVWLGRAESERFLMELLNEPEYEEDAAWALQVIARRTNPGPNVIMGARLGNTARDYRRVRSGASEWRAMYTEDLRAKYATAVRQRILNLLEESKTGDLKTTPYHHRLKELAKVLAALDPQDSADLILDIAELRARSDGWLRLVLLEALVFAGVLIQESRLTAILEPVLAEFRVHGIYNKTGLLTRLLCLLPFVDEPNRGIVRVREILAEFRVSWYDNRDLLFALAQCADETGLELLRDIRDLNNGAFQHIAKDWLEALASCPLSGARKMLLGFVDSDPRAGERTLPDYAVNALASHLVNLARADASIAQRVIARTTEPVSVQQRAILEKVLAWMGTPASLLAGLNLIDDASPQPVPYEIARTIEDVFLEKRPYGGSAQSYTLVPRAAGDLKARLFDMAKHDPRRTRSAHRLIAQIEEWRLEYGRPPSEPRHPAIDSGEMWPPIEPSVPPSSDTT
jgi:HEAT repeat protein